MSDDKRDQLVFAAALGAIIGFAALAKGAYDLWAASLVHVVVLLLFVVFLIRRRDGFPAGFLLPIAFAVAGLGASALFSIKIGDTVWALKDCFFAVIVFMIAADFADSESALNVFLLIMGAVIVLECGLMIWSRTLLAGPAEEAGTLVNANVAAFFFLPWVPVLISRLRGTGPKVLWILALAGAIIGIILAESYAALILLSISLMFFLRSGFNWKTFSYSAVAAAVLVLILLSVREHQLAQTPLYRVSNRLDWWRAGLGMFFDRPLMGVGLGNYQSAFLAYKTGLSQNTLFAHNGIVTLLAETGLLGLVGAVVLFTAWMSSVFKSRRYETHGPFVFGFALLFLYSLYNIGPEYFIGKLLLAVFAGLSAGWVNQISLRKSVLIVLVAAAIGALPYLVTPFLASQNLVAGDKLINSDIEKARAAYQAAVSLDPLLSAAHAGLARAAFLQGHMSESISQQQEALRLDRLNQKLMRDLDQYQRGKESNVS